MVARRAWTVWPKSLTLALVLGSALSASAGQEQLAAAINDTRNEVIATRDQLQVTVDALDALVKQQTGALKPAYDAFVAEVAKTQASASLTTARGNRMQADAATHFNAWQREVDGVTNPKLRKQALKRLTDVQKSYDRATGQLQSAAAAFTPYLSDLADITKVLANDLTPGGVKAIRGTVSKAKFDLGKVRSHIFDAIKELGRMRNSLTSTASQ